MPGPSLFARLIALLSPSALLSRIRSLLAGVLRRDRVEADMDTEFEHHIELRTADLMRQGLAPREASRKARLEFGHIEGHKEAARASRGLGWLDQVRFSWLDVRLGVRMLGKHPALTLAAVFALAIGIPAGLVPSHWVDALEAPLPVPEGERIQLLRFWDIAEAHAGRTTAHEFNELRGRLTSFTAIGAARDEPINLDAEGEASPAVRGAQVTASTFEILRVAPLLGRPLLADDEVTGAAPVVVIAEELWRARFGSDPAIVGRSVRVGGVRHTIVGVMPDGFHFPRNHQAWRPLHLDPSAEPFAGPRLTVFGRLAEGNSADEANAEFSAIGSALARDNPDGNRTLRAEVVPFHFSMLGGLSGGLRSRPEFYLVQLATLMLLAVACANVGLLIFARTATRSSELAVRTALGASRARIILQVFTESLVLAVLAAAVGLVVWRQATAVLLSLAIAETLPYWINTGLTLSTVGKALLLTVASAAAAGLVPALRMTGKSVRRNMERAHSARSGVRFGGVSGALIVADVALAVIVVGFAAGLTDLIKTGIKEPGADEFRAGEFLGVTLTIPMTIDSLGEGDPASSTGSTQQALLDRLLTEPGVRGVAVGSSHPRMDSPSRRIELVDQGPTDESAQWSAWVVQVVPGYFDALDVPIRAGRSFGSSDAEAEGAATVIVSTTFSDRVLAGQNPIGQRFRYLTREGQEPGPTYQIIGVVDDLSTYPNESVYHPVTIDRLNPVRLAIHVGRGADAFIPQLRTLVAGVDPGVVASSTRTLDTSFEGDWYLLVAMVAGGVLLIAILLALCASAIFAIMTYTVTLRTREIGIRAALGAGRTRIAYTVARRAIGQLVLGVLIGLPFAARFFYEINDDAGSATSTALATLTAIVPGVAIMVGVGLIACTGPTLRALRVQPTEALREG